MALTQALERFLDILEKIMQNLVKTDITLKKNFKKICRF